MNKRREISDDFGSRAEYEKFRGNQEDYLGGRVRFSGGPLSTSSPSIAHHERYSPRNDGRSRSPGRNRKKFDARSRSPRRRDSRENVRSRSPGRKGEGRDYQSQSPRHNTRDPGGRGQSPVRKNRAQSPSRTKAGRYNKSQSPSRNTTALNNRSHSPSRSTAGRNNRSHSPNPNTRRGRSPNRSTRDKRSRSQSPNRHNARRTSHSSLRDLNRYGNQPVGLRYEPRHGHEDGEIRYFDAATLEEETTTARVEVLSIVIHVFVILASMMITIPMAQVSVDWQFVRNRCPLFVHNNPQTDVNWGNRDMAPCMFASFMPILVAVLSACLAFFHCSILHAWRIRGDPPSFAFSRNYAVSTMVVTGLQAVLSLAVACTLTDGFRQTCLSFELNPFPDVRPNSCKEGYNDRDFSYGLEDLHTFTKIIVGMVGAWFCTIVTTLLTVIYVIRAKLCSCIVCEL